MEDCYIQSQSNGCIILNEGRDDTRTSVVIAIGAPEEACLSDVHHTDGPDEFQFSTIADSQDMFPKLAIVSADCFA